uniref:Uncharacterized protein n=1 Tax=Oryza brachyantha TaxID=4533 RepID=J3N5E9_ORYBR
MEEGESKSKQMWTHTLARSRSRKKRKLAPFEIGCLARGDKRGSGKEVEWRWRRQEGRSYQLGR